MVELIPEAYDWKVAVKKVLYMVVKVVTAGVIYQNVDHTIAPQVSVASAGALEALHDWAKLKFPNFGWL